MVASGLDTVQGEPDAAQVVSSGGGVVVVDRAVGSGVGIDELMSGAVIGVGVGYVELAKAYVGSQEVKAHCGGCDCGSRDHRDRRVRFDAAAERRYDFGGLRCHHSREELPEHLPCWVWLP